MALIFLNRFYWPDETATAQLLTDLAEALAARGHAVTVIASRPPGAPRVETRRGVRIERVRSTRGHGGNLATKALDFATFALGSVARLVRSARPGDAVIALTDPPLIGGAAWLAARWRGARCHHWIQDIYPEIAVALTGRRELRWIRPLRDWIWRRSAACVTLGADMAAVVAEAGVLPDKISVVPNWVPAGPGATPAAVAALRQAWGLEGKFAVIYSGNLGRVHDLDPIVEVATAVATDPDIRFVFVGDGAGRDAIAAEVGRRGLGNVQFHPPQPRAALAETLAAGDVHLVTLRPGCERYVFPSKLYGAAAAGRPIVFIGAPAAEPARIVAAGGFGRTFDREAVAAIAHTLLELSRAPETCAALAAQARAFASAHTGPAAAADTWERIFRGVQFNR